MNLRVTIVLLALAGLVASASFPPPFYRELYLTAPTQSGNDVVILQHLLKRDQPSTPLSGRFDHDTSVAVQVFQARQKLPQNGRVDVATAAKVLAVLSDDGYHDDGATAASLGYMYKVLVHVHHNRSIESNATLFNATGAPLFQFVVRAHGHNANAPSVWPDFNNTDPGLNQFSSDGNTPTGLIEFDLNSPEDDPKSFGPYPVNRAVLGIRGNAAFLIPNIRNGILLHTGEWPGWSAPASMPNSAGCIHAWPPMIEKVWHTLVGLGVEVRPNTDGKLPYPYKPQGLLSVELVD